VCSGKQSGGLPGLFKQERRGRLCPVLGHLCTVILCNMMSMVLTAVLLDGFVDAVKKLEPLGFN